MSSGTLDGVGGTDSALRVAIRRVRALSWPTSPPPGPLDEAVGMMLHRLVPFQPDWLAALRARLGLDGGPPTVQRAVACVLPPGHVTLRGRPGEGQPRVLAAQNLLRTRLGELARMGAATGAPTALPAALCLLARFAPLAAPDVGEVLQASGLTARAMTMSSIALLARLFGVAEPELVVLGRAPGWVFTPVGVKPMTDVAGRVRRIAQRRGVLRVADLPDDLPSTYWHAAVGLAGDLVEVPDVPGSWVLARDGGSALHGMVLRMLCAAPAKLTTADVDAGLRRASGPGERERLPTVAELAAYLAVQPEVVMSGAGWRLATPTNSSASRSRLDQVWLALLSRRTLVSWTELVCAARDAGLSSGGAAVSVVRAPYLRSVARGQYELVGRAGTGKTA
ncbi:MAG: hypothetical protein ACYDAQ_02055 [Mycobacteriales bacterium]